MNNIIPLYELLSQMENEIILKIRKELEYLFPKTLEKLRDTVIGSKRYDHGNNYYRWGYNIWKGLDTGFGYIKQVKIPRIREKNGGKEIPIIDRNSRYSLKFISMLGDCFVNGQSLRSLTGFFSKHFNVSISSKHVSNLIDDVDSIIQKRRFGKIDNDKFIGLVLDGIYFTIRQSSAGRQSRRKKKHVLLVALGVTTDGKHRVLDWECRAQEDLKGYELLLERLYSRGLKDLRIVVGDGEKSIWSAVDLVYPFALRQRCLFHVQSKTLNDLLIGDEFTKKRFRIDFWNIYNVASRNALSEAHENLSKFKEKWYSKEPLAVKRLCELFPDTINFLKIKERWNYKLRTNNLAEGFFRNLRRFLGRYPGFNSKDHLLKSFAMYLKGAESSTWRYAY